MNLRERIKKLNDDLHPCRSEERQLDYIEAFAKEVRDQALEEAAQQADHTEERVYGSTSTVSKIACGHGCANRIRSLKSGESK